MSKEKPVWLKWRHMFSYGYSPWEWKFIGFEKSTGEDFKNFVEEYILEDLKEEYSWSDQYRDVDYELVKDPPEEVVQEKINLLSEEIRNKQHVEGKLKYYYIYQHAQPPKNKPKKTKNKNDLFAGICGSINDNLMNMSRDERLKLFDFIDTRYCLDCGEKLTERSPDICIMCGS